MGEDEKGQLSSSLVVIHMIGAAKALLKSLPNSLPRAHHVTKKGLLFFATHTPQIGAIV